MIEAIIVEDEAPARREMHRLLAEHDTIRVVGEAKDVDGARGLLLRTRPEVVFLDVRLGRASGFDLLGDVDEETAVVFVTAHDDYAVRAFEEHALDYLVKPVEPARLAEAIVRVERFVAARGDPEASAASREPAPFTPLRWVFLEVDAPEFLEVDAITQLVAEEGGSRVHTVDGRVRASRNSLAAWRERLPEGDFARVHRSTLVNLRHVEHVEPWSNYTYRLHLRGSDAPVTMSRRHASRIRDLLG